MKTMKKLLALLLVFVMMMALGTTAFADSSEEDAKGSIKIENTDKFDPVGTYTAYKIFDVTYADGEDEDGAFSYTIADDSVWMTVVEDFFTCEASEADDSILVVTPNDDYDAAAFAAALKTAYDAMTTKPTGTALAGEGEEELALGYWFVTTTTGSLCNLTTTHPDSTINDKNEPLPFDKDLDDAKTEIVGSVQLGDVVPYVITSKVPSTVGYTEYTYIVTDTMAGGVFQEDVVVKFGDDTIDTTGKLVCADNGFTLTFDMTDYQDYVGETITITYSAVVDESSLATGEEINTATLEHSHNPADDDDLKKEPDYKIILKTFSIDLTKVAEDGTTPLDGAKFVLMNGDKYYSYDEDKEEVVWVTDISDALEITTDANGKGDKEFVGLAEGSYDLIETKAPAGYNLPKDSFTVVISKDGDPLIVSEEDTDKDGKIDLITKETQYEATVNGEEADIEDLNYVATTIENHAGTLLPETGGFGTTMLLVLGAVLFMGTALILVTKKRMYNEG